MALAVSVSRVCNNAGPVNPPSNTPGGPPPPQHAATTTASSPPANKIVDSIVTSTGTANAPIVGVACGAATAIGVVLVRAIALAATIAVAAR